MTKITDFKLNDSVEGFFLVKKADIRKTKNGDDFLSLTISDRSGDLPGNFWSVDDNTKNTITDGIVAHVTGSVKEFNSKLQINVDTIRAAKESEAPKPSDFVKQAPINENQMRDQFNQFLLKIENATWNKIVRDLFQKYDKLFFSQPAASKNHHAFVGGLAYHSLTMANLADSITAIYPQLNSSLLIAGALLHDLGKVIELSGPIATSYTLQGTLIGHITLIDEQIAISANELSIDINDEDLVVLRHVVLSHHGLMEYGSPVMPMMREAVVLNQIDEIDAKQQMLETHLESTESGEFTDRIFGMDGRRFYKYGK